MLKNYLKKTYSDLPEPELILPNPEFGDIGLDDEQRANLEKVQVESQRALQILDQFCTHGWAMPTRIFTEDASYFDGVIDPHSQNETLGVVSGFYFQVSKGLEGRDDYSHLNIYIVENSRRFEIREPKAIHRVSYRTTDVLKTRIVTTCLEGHIPFRSPFGPSQTQTQWRRSPNSDLWELSEHQLTTPNHITVTRTKLGNEWIFQVTNWGEINEMKGSGDKNTRSEALH